MRQRLVIDSNFATETRIHSSKYPLKHWGLWVHRCNERRSARSRRGPVFAANRHRPASSPQPDDLVEMVFVRPVNGTRRRSRSLQWQWALCRRLRPPRRAPPAPADFQAPGTAGCATRSTGTGSLLDHDAFDFVERDRVRRPVVELRRLRRRMPGDPLGVLERPAAPPSGGTTPDLSPRLRGAPLENPLSDQSRHQGQFPLGIQTVGQVLDDELVSRRREPQRRPHAGRQPEFPAAEP